jgi:hypothetical protein
MDESDTPDPAKQWGIRARRFNRYGLVLAGKESLLLEETPLNFISIEIPGQFY